MIKEETFEFEEERPLLNGFLIPLFTFGLFDVYISLVVWAFYAVGYIWLSKKEPNEYSRKTFLFFAYSLPILLMFILYLVNSL